jgi:glycosyltransferase involved in cell wall biosynthesis
VSGADNGRLQSLKICLATWAPFVGGAEVAAERTAIGLRDAGHDVFLLVGQPGPVLERYQKVGLRCVVAKMRFTGKWSYPLYWLARRNIAGILRREKPDLVHTNDLPTHATVADAARRAGIPRLCHHRFPFPPAALDWMNKFGAERHVYVSRYLLETLEADSASLRSAPSEVLYDGLPLGAVPTSEERRAARVKLGLPQDRVVVVFTGQVIERKGVADLIRAWSLLPSATRERAELVIVGDDLAGGGAYRAEMEQLARSENCPARFVGFQKNVPDWLAAADVAAVPSHVEPLGNATLEAMACAVPVLGSTAGGIPEMVVDGETGLLVPPKTPAKLSEALGRLIGDSELRIQLGRAGRRRCEELFGLDVHVRNVLASYRQLLSLNPSRPGR